MANRTRLGCPPMETVQSLVLSYLTVFWVENHCSEDFPMSFQSSLQMRLHPKHNDVCELDVAQFQGDFRFRISTIDVARALSKPGLSEQGQSEQGPVWDRIVLNASMRLASHDEWVSIGGRLCALVSTVGLIPLSKPVAPSVLDWVAFVLNENRRIFECGGKVHLAGPPGLALGGVMGRSWILHVQLTILVDDLDRVGEEQQIQRVRVAIEGFQSIPNFSQTAALTFLGSEPSPCDIGRQRDVTNEPASSAQLPIVARTTPALEVAEDDSALEILRFEVEQLPGVKAFAKTALLAKGLKEIPTSFDFRSAAPPVCVKKPQAQGRCIAGWVFAAVGAFEKQACMLSDGLETTSLSTQHVLDCAHSSDGCFGGRLEDAFYLFYSEGALPEHCVPWSSPEGLDSSSPADLLMPTSSSTVPRNFTSPFPVPGQQANQDKCFRFGFSNTRANAADDTNGRPCNRLRGRLPSQVEQNVLSSVMPWASLGVMAVKGDFMIRMAILTIATVTARIPVYPDFLSYQGGVYFKQADLDHADVLGFTAVQLIGWGQLRDSSRHVTLYWTCENSFGSAWGEEGYFRWPRGNDYLGIESRALFGLVSGLHDKGSVSQDVGSTADALDQYRLFHDQAVADETLNRSMATTNLWLAGGMSVSFGIAIAVCAFVLRRCLCPEHPNFFKLAEGESSE